MSSQKRYSNHLSQENNQLEEEEATPEEIE